METKMPTAPDRDETRDWSEPRSGDLLYRFEGRLTEVNVAGQFPEGIRMACPFEGLVTEGPLAGGRVWGVDHFLMRPDLVGIIDAPETISLGDRHVVGHVRAYAVAPADVDPLPLESILDPEFRWPERPFRISGSALFRAAPPELEWLNRTVAVIEGEVDLNSGALRVEARAA